MAASETPEPSGERRRFLAGWPRALVAGVAITLGLVAFAVALVPAPAGSLIHQDIPGSAATFVLGLATTIVGLMLRRNGMEHPVGWILLAFGLAVGAAAGAWAVHYLAGFPGGDPRVGQGAAWLGTVITAPVWVYLATALIIRFPSGRADDAFDARLLQVAPPIALAVAVFSGLRPGRFLIYGEYDNPIALPPGLDVAATWGSVLTVVAAMVVLGLAAANMLRRYRRAASIERLQLRWFVSAGVLTLLSGLVYVIVVIVLASPNDSLRALCYILLTLAWCSLPIAVLQAITRHHLYDIDTIISRTFAYGALTAILAGVYSASVRGFNALFVWTTGENSEAALVLTTLVLATTFTPIKTRLERFVARRLTPTPVPAAPVALPPDPELDARIEAAVRRAVDTALREREARGEGDAGPV